MRNRFLPFVVLLFVFLVCGPAVYAQGGVRSGPDPSTIRDPDLEKDSFHNLEVARHYFKLKKAYVAAIKRCEEIIAGNPNFARIDEVLFIAGESSLRLAESKGKQKQSKLTPDQLRDGARDYLTQLAVDHPNSPFNKDAEEDLRSLGGPKPPVSKQ
jgi:outer membrane protein assembly factor BamD (BamD/ComL family)